MSVIVLCVIVPISGFICGTNHNRDFQSVAGKVVDGLNYNQHKIGDAPCKTAHWTETKNLLGRILLLPRVIRHPRRLPRCCLSAMQTISQSLLTAPRSHARCTEPMVPYAWHRYGVIAGGCTPSNALLLWFPRHWRSLFTQTD